MNNMDKPYWNIS